jgi:single-strand DNA-binding protein
VDRAKQEHPYEVPRVVAVPIVDGGPDYMTEASVSFAGNLTDDPEVRYTECGIARAIFRVAVSERRKQEPSFFTVVVWRDQAEHAAESLTKGSRVVVVGRLQQRTWTAQDGTARSVVEVVAEELGPSLRWGTATTTRATRSRSQQRLPYGSISRSRSVGDLPCSDRSAGFRSRGIRGTTGRPDHGCAASGGVGFCSARTWPSRPPWA